MRTHENFASSCDVNALPELWLQMRLLLVFIRLLCVSIRTETLILLQTFVLFHPSDRKLIAKKGVRHVGSTIVSTNEKVGMTLMVGAEMR